MDEAAENYASWQSCTGAELGLEESFASQLHGEVYSCHHQCESTSGHKPNGGEAERSKWLNW